MNKSVIVYCAEDGGTWRHLVDLSKALGLTNVIKGWSGRADTFEPVDHLFILHDVKATIEWRRGDSGVRMLSAEEAKIIATEYQKSVAIAAPVAV